MGTVVDFGTFSSGIVAVVDSETSFVVVVAASWRIEHLKVEQCYWRRQMDLVERMLTDIALTCRSHILHFGVAVVSWRGHPHIDCPVIVCRILQPIKKQNKNIYVASLSK